jgi:hypothetical protein
VPTNRFADELAAQLHRIDPQLTFETRVATSEHELIVSADGIWSAFPTVERLVAGAPPIPGWKITAFRPRKSIISRSSWETALASQRARSFSA